MLEKFLKVKHEPKFNYKSEGYNQIMQYCQRLIHICQHTLRENKGESYFHFLIVARISAIYRVKCKIKSSSPNLNLIRKKSSFCIEVCIVN